MTWHPYMRKPHYNHPPYPATITTKTYKLTVTACELDHEFVHYVHEGNWRTIPTSQVRSITWLQTAT